MADFGKRLKNKEVSKLINPIEIYESLDRRSIAGPLRNAQINVLSAWHSESRNQRDLIVKLHTGEGKTLIGLLVLQSKLNENGGPCLYLCPNKYLVNQTLSEARKFGVPCCFIEDVNLPDEFLEGKKILVTTVKKLFNGRTKFGLNNNYVDVNSIVLDDSHACVDIIRESFTIKIQSDHEMYTKLRGLFENDIREQGEGSYLEIKEGGYPTMLPIPYWSWSDRKDDVLEILAEFKSEQQLSFIWPLLKDNIENCQAFITGQEIEIYPYYIPLHFFKSFTNAKHRILMSATTQDDSFFIKGLGFNINAVNAPLKNIDEKWSGEKMILIPSLMHDNLTRIDIINKMAKLTNSNFGIAALVPSFKVAEHYITHGSRKITSENISEIIGELKTGVFGTPVIIANRYDGIDLPDETCRILIFDSMPYFSSLVDKYEESCRIHSDVVNIKYAQKIEQGLGRSVRGEKDYSAIVLIGPDLVNFVKNSRTNRFFSSQTRKQIDIGLDIVELAEEDLVNGEDPYKVFANLIVQLLKRDKKWKEYYIEQMNEIEDNNANKVNLYNILELEREAEFAYFNREFGIACQKVQTIIDNYCSDENEKGWYLQFLARYQYSYDKSISNITQKSAYLKNYQLLKPKEGITYKKLSPINEGRIRRVKNFMLKFQNYEDFMLSIESYLNDFAFGVPSEKCEAAIQNIGLLLGFLSQRPDKEFKKGPDNLWCGVNQKYIFFECKSQVDDDRQEISKQEAGQMNNHCGWFDSEYENNTNVVRVLIIPTKTLSNRANFTHEVRIMRKSRMKNFRENIRHFAKQFKLYNIHEMSDEKIQQFLNDNKLGEQDIYDTYTEAVYCK